jgi:septum formation protein
MADASLLVLASTSRYRRELLSRLGLPFDVIAPEVDEHPLPGETPAAMAWRLAAAKARAVARQRPDAVVIGSDQVAELDGQAVGKPGTHARAVQQLQAMRGRQVLFHTAVAVVRADGGFERTAMSECAWSSEP